MTNSITGDVGGHVVQVGSARDIHVSGSPVTVPAPTVWWRIAIGATAGALVAGAVILVYDWGRRAEAPVSRPTAAGGASTPGTTSDPGEPGVDNLRYAQISSDYTGYCLEASTDRVSLAECDGRPAQQWAWVPGNERAAYRVINQGTGYCLDIEQFTVMNRPCGLSGGNQVWVRELFTEDGDHRRWRITSSGTTDCLTAFKSSPRPVGPPYQAVALAGCDITEVAQLFRTPSS